MYRPDLTCPVTSANSPGTDYTLNNIFTSLYGWTAILGAFLLATLCVIKEVSPRSDSEMGVLSVWTRIDIR